MRNYLLLLCWLAANATGAQSITWITACSNQTFCLNPGSCTEGNVSLAERAVTTCSGGLLSYSYRIDLFNNGSIDINSSLDSINEPFPLGTHKIIWRATNNCGQASQCTYLFAVEDCSPPSLVCSNALSQTLDPPSCSATFFVTQFILSLSDNCTPTPNIEIAMRKAGTGTGFPTETMVTYDSCDVGTRTVEVWVRDDDNLVNSCQAEVHLQHSPGCSCKIDADLDFRGCLRAAGGTPLTQYGVHTRLTGGVPPNDSMVWNLIQLHSDSCYSQKLLAIPFGGNYDAEIWANKLDTSLNGFSTYDLLLISKHILAIEPFTSFYQILAADLNGSHSVTTFDILEGRKRLLGIYDSFPSVPAWHLIRPLSMPANLLQWDSIQTQYNVHYNNLQADQLQTGLDFVAIKSGDVNLSASIAPRAEDRKDSALPLSYTDRCFKPGEHFDLELTLPTAPERAVEAWQWALAVDPSKLAIEGMEGIQPACYNVNALRSELRALWYRDPLDATMEAPEQVLRIHCQALSSGRLSDCLYLNEQALSPEWYCQGPQAIGQPNKLFLAPRGDMGSANELILVVSPNPFHEQTSLSYYSPRAGLLHLELFDMQGRLVKHLEKEVDDGAGILMLDAGDLLFPGYYVYRICIGGTAGYGRLVRY